MFGRIGVLKNICKFDKQTPMLESILMNTQASNLQPETLIKKDTPTHVFSCKFCKKIKKSCFLEQVHTSVVLTLLKYDCQFIGHFSQTFVTFQTVDQTQ